MTALKNISVKLFSIVMRKFIVVGMLSVLFTSLVAWAVPIGHYPGLKKLIGSADAIVILRIDRHLSGFGSPTFYSTHECYIYQTIKGDIQANTRMNLRLMNTDASFASPYAHGSTHLMFLMKRATKDEPTEYRTITFKGAQILLSPLGHEKAPTGKTIYQKVRNVISDAIAYQAKEHEKKQKFLKTMLEKEEDAEKRINRWIHESAIKMAGKRGRPGVVSMCGIGANDVILLAKTDPLEEIFSACLAQGISPPLNSKTCNSFLKSCIAEIHTIQPGSTRADVLRVLDPDGGLSTRSCQIYHSKRCQYLKVRIAYDYPRSKDRDKDMIRRAEDIVSDVSPVYLGLVIMD
ncbi:MAG: hypothetical protein ACYS0H_12740 [Planctomycetota bacterium]|jgi:hypothetical protein